ELLVEAVDLVLREEAEAAEVGRALVARHAVGLRAGEHLGERAASGLPAEAADGVEEAEGDARRRREGIPRGEFVGRGGLEAGVDLAVVAAAGLGHGEVLGLGRRVAEVGQQEAPPALPRLGVADELLEVRRPRAAAALDGVEDAPSGGLVPVAEAPDAVGPLVV